MLVINNVECTKGFMMCHLKQMGAAMSGEALIQSFMNENSSLKGLSLAIGGHSTCLIASENSLASLSLASRLSKSLNNNGPVYVANNLEAIDKLEEIYNKIFQFVRDVIRKPNT